LAKAHPARLEQGQAVQAAVVLAGRTELDQQPAPTRAVQAGHTAAALVASTADMPSQAEQVALALCE
jgi:hypothetical protein